MAIRIPDPLVPLFEQGLVEEVIRPLMSGKEASVYLVQARGIQCVAKVYKDAQHRSFRQRADYAEGRHVRNSRQSRAMLKGSEYGKSLLEASWQSAEVEALRRLHAAGVRVPVPYHHAENVLLMELVADANGDPAPRLDDMHLTKTDALLLHEILLRDVVRMLCAGLVHGDLSQYNILIAEDGPVIIDLPQTTDAANNRSSERIFLRDVKNLATFFGRTAPSLRHTKFGPEIWDLYSRAELHPESELTGRFATNARRVDTEGVIAEIQDSAAEAEARPISAYQLKKKKKTEAARRARDEEERRALQPKKAASEKSESKQTSGRKPAKPRGGRRRRGGRKNRSVGKSSTAPARQSSSRQSQAPCPDRDRVSIRDKADTSNWRRRRSTE